jgi:hypothetical protein
MHSGDQRREEREGESDQLFAAVPEIIQRLVRNLA